MHIHKLTIRRNSGAIANLTIELSNEIALLNISNFRVNNSFNTGYTNQQCIDETIARIKRYKGIISVNVD